MDIIVTIPKSEYENDNAETKYFKENEDTYQFWTLSKVPKNTKAGDRIYFIKNNKIESSMRIFMLAEDNIQICKVTGRIWQGKCVIMMDDLREESFDIKVKGFQGFRYFDKFMEVNGYEM